MRTALAMIAPVAVAFCLSIAATAALAMTEPCSSSGDGSLLKCYQAEYQEKYRSNKERYENLAERAKDAFHSASEKDDKKRAASLSLFIRRMSGTIISHRKSASGSCTKLVGKFHSQDTAAIAAINCRSSHEVKLDQRLRELENSLDELTRTERR